MKRIILALCLTLCGMMLVGVFAAGQSTTGAMSADLSPKSFDAEKSQVSILLEEHDFPAALDLATVLNKKVPDDVAVYGLLTDANTELGNYGEAETSAQWMLNLRPGNVPALTHASHLREIFGDLDGAYELMDLAYQSTAPTDTEQRAWILAQMGHLRLAAGNPDAPEKLLEQALGVLSNYPAALGELAKVRVAQERYQDAIALLRQLYESVPRLGNLYELAEALLSAGRDAEAKKAFAEFETKALAESDKKDNSNRELIFYYADRAQQPAKALELAQQEFGWRHDVYTLDAYAWALHVNGQDAEARKQVESALAVGVRDAKLFLHAGAISLTLGDVPAAERYLRQSAELSGADSAQARSMLASLTMPSGR